MRRSTFFTSFILEHLDAYRPNRIGRTAFDAKGRYHFERSSLRKIAGFCNLLELFEKRIAHIGFIAFGLMMEDGCNDFVSVSGAVSSIGLVISRIEAFYGHREVLSTSVLKSQNRFYISGWWFENPLTNSKHFTCV